ncbi:MAG: tRNA-dihydrouridine synthase family protein [Candidatus Woesearchaeota archaeon]
MFHKSFLHLAPMHDYTDVAFRTLISKTAKVVTYSEMLHSEAIIRNKIETWKIERGQALQYGVQIFGNKMNEMIKAAKILEKNQEVDFINFNFGCPSKNILDSKAGGYWLKNPKRMILFSKKCRKELSLPYSFKTRLGYGKDISKILTNLDVDELILHGRTVKQGFSGKANYESIYKVKEQTNFSVVGNGDIFTKEDFFNRKKNLDGLMIARGVLANPSIFSEIENNKKLNQKDLFFHYIELAQEFKIDFYRIKNVSFVFSKGMNNAKQIREKISKAKTIDEIINTMK